MPMAIDVMSERIDGHSGWSDPWEEPLRIAVLRANGLGDLVFALPALHALRAAEPDAEIVLLGNALYEETTRVRPCPVSRVEVLPQVPGVTCGPDEGDEAAVDEAVERLRHHHFDVALQLHGGGRYSNSFLRRLHPTLTAGLQAGDAEPLDLELPYTLYQSEVLRNLEVVGLLGAEPVHTTPRFSVTDADRAELAALDLPTDRLVIALHPGARDPRRRWSTSGFADVAASVAADGAVPVVTGTESEAELTKVVVGDGHDVVDATGALSPGGLAALCERANVVVANDTGPLHLAAAVGTRTVGVFWCGNLVNAGPLTRERHRPQIGWTVDCPVCGTNCTRDDPPCDHEASFVDDVTVAEVRGATRDLVEAELSR